MRKKSVLWAALAAACLLAACGSGASSETTAAATEAAETSAPETSAEAEATTEATEAESEAEASANLMVAAAASLEYAFREQLIPQYEAAHPGITIEGTYDSSGKLQTQIESGLEADIFMSAAMKQMNALVEEGGFIADDTVTKLLENKIVLIVPASAENTELTSFEDIVKAESVALGDPASVPVGQYSEEALTNLGLWDQIQDRVSLGTNVTEVLNWVAEGSADCGIVYATDAATTDKVKVIAEAPAGSLASPVIYPIAMLENADPAAKDFFDYLCSDEALKVYESYGFSAYTE